MLNAPIPERIYFYPIDRAVGTATFQAQDSKFSVKMAIHNFLGCIGVAPAGGEARSSIVPAEFGGNMDAPEASVGNILYLPVNAPGALLYIGDGHAVMGDGQIAGTAVEVPLRVRLRARVIKGKKIDWPRFEDQDEIMAAGIYRPSTIPSASPSPNSSPGSTPITASPSSTPTNSSRKSPRSTSPKWSIPITSSSPKSKKNTSRRKSSNVPGQTRSRSLLTR